MGRRIFINYRRSEDWGAAQALYQQLAGAFPPDDIFMDVEGHIRPGDDFVAVLTAQVAACDVLLALIGPRWAELIAARARGPDGGEEDFVVIEVAAALEHGKRVIPVLIGNAAMPRADALPLPIRRLARLNAVSLRPERFAVDCQGLVTALKKHFAALDQEHTARLEAEHIAAEAERKKRTAEAAALRRAEPLRWQPIAAAAGVAVAVGFAVYIVARPPEPNPAPAPPSKITAAPPPRQVIRVGPRVDVEIDSADKVAKAALVHKEVKNQLGVFLGVDSQQLWFSLPPESGYVVSKCDAHLPQLTCRIDDQNIELLPKEGALLPTAVRVRVEFSPALNPGRMFRDCADVCPEMVVVPAGSFTMGSNEYDDEKPQRKVTIAHPFAVGKFEVTFAEWDACVAAGGCSHRPADQGWGRGRRPVINVTWHDAKEFAAWLSRKTGKTYRLLSEAEWEYAARAGTTTRYAFGDTISKSQAQSFEGSASKTVEVGSFPANKFGLHDMHGNVWEWVEDASHPNYQGAPSDGSVWPGGDTSLRVLRGGSWFDIPRYLRSASRYGVPPANRSVDVGFRVATTH